MNTSPDCSIGRSAALALAVAAMSLTTLPATFGAPSAGLRQLLASGQRAPDGGTFDDFDVAGQAIPAASNRTGQVAFFAKLIRGAAQEGLFIVHGNRIAKIAAAGDRIPGGERIADFTERPGLALNGSGAVAFAAALTGGKATSGMFLAIGGKLVSVALSGAAAPEIAGGTLTSFERPVINDEGSIAFLASVRRSRDLADAIFLLRRGVLRKVAGAGDNAPGGGVFSGFGTPAVNNRRAVAFSAVVDQGPVLGGIYAIAEGQPRLALAVGSAAPNGGVFAKISEQVAIDDSGAIVFTAVLRQGGPSAAVFRLDREAAISVAAVGDPAPGGGRFAGFLSPPALSPGGTICFVASIDGGPNPVAVYLAGRSGLQRLAGIGDTLPDGSRLTGFPRYPTVAIGPDDAVTFAATAERDGTTREALFYAAPSGSR